MKRVLSLCALVLSLALSVHTQQAQQSQQNQPTASIEGSVLKFGTTEGVARAKVTLRPTNSPNSQTITADEGGKFMFRDLVPGQYRLTVTRDGFVGAEYGQRSPSSGGIPIALTTQQQFKDARISMTPSGTISGRIVNRYGEPVGNANVQALRYTYQDGKRSLTQAQTIRTNDLGEYRLFWMTPGQYIISAQGNDAVVVDPGGTIMFTSRVAGPGGPGGALANAGLQLGVGGITSIAIGGARGGDMGPMVGPGGAPVPPPPPPAPGVAQDDSNLSLPVYFPGTTDSTAATPVDLRAGGSVAGINLTLIDAKPVKIRGQVLSGGRPASGAQVAMYQRNSANGSLTIRQAPVNNDTGAFEFRSVAPGGYELIATLNGFGPGAQLVGTPLGAAAGFTATNVRVGGGRGNGGPMMGGRSSVDVNQQDVDVTILLENGFNLAGRVAIEGQVPDATLQNVRVQIQSDPVIPPLAVPAAFPEADGSFSVQGVAPGNYRLNVAGLPRNTYLKAARIAGTDVLNNGLRLDSSPGGPLEIVLGNGPGTVDATVTDDRQMPVQAVTVALVPNSAAQEKRYDLYRSATTDASGKIHLDNVVPGEYKIYAWESVENGAWTDPTFMRAFQNSGTIVRVTENGRGNADVRVIPYRLN